MPAVIESSVARAPSPSSSAGSRQQAGSDTPSSPFSELLDSCAPPDASENPAPATTAEPPRAKGATPGAKPDAADVPVDPEPEQLQTELLQAIAAIIGEPAAAKGKDTTAPAKTIAAGVAKDETQPDAEAPALPKDAESPDGPIVTQPAPVPATVMPPVVAVPAPVPIPVPAPAPSPAEIAVISEAATASPSIDAAATKGTKDIKPSAAKPAGDDATAVAGKAMFPTGETAGTVSQAEDAGDEPAAKPAGDTPAPKPEKVAAAPVEITPPGNDTTKAAPAPVPEQQATPEVQSPEPDAANANPDVEKAPGRAANAAAKPHAADSDAPQPKDANPAASSSTPGNPTLPAPAAAHSAAAHAMPPTSHRFGASETVPIEGLAVEIAARAEAGKNHFQIRLDPPELGHIHVQLQIDGDGNVTSHLRVDRVETLDLLRREAPTLERALQDAGLKTADSGLQFSLRNQSFSQHDQGRDMQAMAQIVLPDETIVPTETQRHYGRLAGVGGGVDIRV